MSANSPQRSTSIRDFDFAYFVRHYVSLLLRRMPVLIVSSILVTGLAAICYIKFAVINPDLPATAIIGFENPGDQSAVQDFGGGNDGRTALIQSRNFLQEVVTSLSLQLETSGLSRSDVFDSVRIDSTALPGGYQIEPLPDAPDSFNVFFKNGFLGLRRSLVCAGMLTSRNVILLPGAQLRFARSFVDHPTKVSFRVTKLRDAVEDVVDAMNVDGLQSRRGQSNLVLSIKGQDYPLIALTANTIADHFVAKNLSFRKRKVQTTIEVLEKQLAMTSKDLSDAEGELEKFRSENPGVGLTENAQQTLASLGQLERGSFDMRSTLSEGEEIQSRIASADPGDRAFAASIAIGFLSSKGNTAAEAFKTELTRLLAERAALERGYAPDHPLRLENVRRMSALENNVQANLSGFLHSQAEQTSKSKFSIQSLSQTLRSLPAKELQLAELQRRQQLSADIHTTVLTRYNQAKISDAVETTDAYVMDYAVVPVPPSPKPGKVFLICTLVGVVLTFAGIIFFDLIDKTARTEGDLMRLTNKPVLASIPVMRHKRPQKGTAHHALPAATLAQLDQMRKNHLISSHSDRTYIAEIFRALRTKVLFKLDGVGEKCVAISSLERGCGKSTVAANLAIALAESNLRTILIDADLHCGMLSERFGVQKVPGLVEAILHPDKDGAFIQQTAVPNLRLIASGIHTLNPLDLLTSTTMQNLKSRLLRSADIVVIDTPPLGAVTDAASMNELFAACLFVVRAGMTKITDLTRRISEYTAIEEKLIGFVLNGALTDEMILYYQNSNYYPKAAIHPVTDLHPPRIGIPSPVQHAEMEVLSSTKIPG